MPDRLAVDEENHLKEIPAPEYPDQPAALRIPAIIISFLFHPLFIPLYGMLFLIKLQPQLFAAFDEWGKLKYLLQTFVNCTFLPLVSVLLLRKLNFIDSVFLRTQKDRIAPYVISMIFYFWNWYVFKNNFAITEVVSFSLAVFIASVIGFLFNIYYKISMHALAMGVFCGFVGLLAVSQSTNLTTPLSIVIVIAGGVCTSRLMVSDHRPQEVYLGFLYGVAAQVMAHLFTA